MNVGIMDILEALAAEIVALNPDLDYIRVLENLWQAIKFKHKGDTFYLIYYIDDKNFSLTNIHQHGPGLYGCQTDEFGFKPYVGHDFFSMLENPDIEVMIAKAVKEALDGRK